MNVYFGLISCHMPKSESVVVFEILFDNLATGMVLEVSNVSFNIFRVYIIIMFIPPK